MSPAIPNSIDELLQRMVQFDTVNSVSSCREKPEQALATWLEEVARAWSMQTRWLPWSLTEEKRRETGGNLPRPGDQLLITVPASATVSLSENACATASAPWILFDSHLDTVAVDGMTIDPFGGIIEGDRLLGRGACDTKGTGAAMLWALKQYAAQSNRPSNIALLFSVDEECSMTGIASFIEHHLPTIGFHPAAVIVGEPTMMRPVVTHNGVTRWNVTTTGVAAHAAASYLGKSAIRMMGKVMEAIETKYIALLDVAHPLTGGAVCNITTIEGGSQVNIIPDHCTIAIDRRLAPSEDAIDATAKLQAVLDDLVKVEPEIVVKLEMFREAPPLNEQASAKVLPVVQEVLAKFGMPKAAMGAPFATHGGDLADAGLPALVWGPGEPYSAHTKAEFVGLPDIRQGATVYLAFMNTTAFA